MCVCVHACVWVTYKQVRGGIRHVFTDFLCVCQFECESFFNFFLLFYLFIYVLISCVCVSLSLN